MNTEEKINQLLLNVFRDKELVENWLSSPNYMLKRIPKSMILNGEDEKLLVWLENTILKLRSKV